MLNLIRKICLMLTLLMLNFSSAVATSITIIENTHGTKNYLLALYLVAMFVFWIFIFLRTSPIEYKENNALMSISNSVVRLLCYVWFLAVFWTFRAVLFISTSSTFLDDKLYIFNLLSYVTLALVLLFIILNMIKFWGQFTGVEEFARKVIYEVKNYE